MGWWNTNSGSVIGAAGSLIGGWLGMSGQRDANKMNLKLQQRQQAYETTMSNTAVQRRAADIAAAGGNPALAFTNGQEATTPSVQPATMQNERAQAGEMIANIGPKMIAAKIAQQQIEASKAGIELTKAQQKDTLESARNRAVDTMLKLSTGMKTDQEIENLQATKREIEARVKQITTQQKAEALAIRLKEATFDDLVSLAKSEADAAKYGVSKREWESLIYGALNKWFGPSTPGSGGKPPRVSGPSYNKQPWEQRHGVIKR